MYFLQHYVIDWDKVKTIDDVKTILRAIQVTFGPDHFMIRSGELLPYVELRDKQPLDGVTFD